MRKEWNCAADAVGGNLFGSRADLEVDSFCRYLKQQRVFKLLSSFPPYNNTKALFPAAVTASCVFDSVANTSACCRKRGEFFSWSSSPLLPIENKLLVVSHPQVAWPKRMLVQMSAPSAACAALMSHTLSPEAKNTSKCLGLIWNKSRTSKSVSCPITAVGSSSAFLRALWWGSQHLHQQGVSPLHHPAMHC